MFQLQDLTLTQESAMKAVLQISARLVPSLHSTPCSNITSSERPPRPPYPKYLPCLSFLLSPYLIFITVWYDYMLCHVSCSFIFMNSRLFVYCCTCPLQSKSLEGREFALFIAVLPAPVYSVDVCRMIEWSSKWIRGQVKTKRIKYQMRKSL